MGSVDRHVGHGEFHQLITFPRRPEKRTPFGTTPVPRFLRGERASVSPASVARRTSLAYGCVHARRWKRQVANPRRTHRRHIGLVQETVACPLSRSHQSDGALSRSSGRANGDGNCFGSTTPTADNPTALRASDEPSGLCNRQVLSDSGQNVLVTNAKGRNDQ